MNIRTRNTLKVWAGLLMLFALAVPVLWASDNLPYTWFQTNGQPGVLLDANGNFKQFVAGATVSTSGLSLPTGNSTLSFLNSSGSVIGGAGTDGFPRVSTNSFGTITGSGAATYTVTLGVPASDATYNVVTQAVGTSNTTACTLNVGTITTTGFVVTPSAPSAFPAGRNIYWQAFRNN